MHSISIRACMCLFKIIFMLKKSSLLSWLILTPSMKEYDVTTGIVSIFLHSTCLVSLSLN